VDLHSRGGSSALNLIVQEARVLLEFRHPNILFMLGVVLDYPEGPTLVMEQSWGSVMAALRSGPVCVGAGVKIAKQVASTLNFLHIRNIFHGQVGTRTVLLTENLRKMFIIAKLANFSSAQLNVKDEAILGRDIRSFGVFLYHLFAKRYSGAGPGLEELSRFSLQELQDNITIAELGPALKAICSGGVSSAWVLQALGKVLDPFEEGGVRAAPESPSPFGTQHDSQSPPGASATLRPPSSLEEFPRRDEDADPDEATRFRTILRL
jgi:serine/threonine protein kinase